MCRLLLGHSSTNASFAKIPTLAKLKEMRMEALVAHFSEAKDEDPLGLNQGEATDSKATESKKSMKTTMKTDTVVQTLNPSGQPSL